MIDYVIRDLRGQAEYRAAEQLQLAVWGSETMEVVPDHMLLTAHKYGGTVIGAFASGELVGFVFGFVGLEGGRPVHCSHLAAVLPEHRDAGLGRRLKLAQREAALAHGLDRIVWTYDPLQSRNAGLNIRKLGATCRTYVRELYGAMRDTLNAELPSDRFTVDWWIGSRHVARRLAGERVASLAELRAAGVPLLNPPAGDAPLAPERVGGPAGPRALVAVPRDIDAVKAAGGGAALAWRMQTRAVFEGAFEAGYTVVDVLADEVASYYLLMKDWQPDAD